MSFYKKYELIDVLRDDGVKTFQAREIDSGRMLEVHLLVGVPGKSDPPYDLLESIRGFPADKCGNLVETGEHMGTPYVVTLPLSGSSLRDWVQANKVDPNGAPETLARVGRWRIPPSMRDPGTPPEIAAQPPQKTEQIQQPDTPDITRMFKTAEVVIPQGGVQSPWTTAEMATPSRGPSSPAPSTSTDDFDILFGGGPPSTPSLSTSQQKAPQPPNPAAIPETAPSAKPDDFARMFQTGGFAKATEPPAAPVSPPPVQSPPAGEFTSMFSAPSPVKSAEPDDFNRMFDSATGRIKTGDVPKMPPPLKPEPPKPAAAAPQSQAPAAQAPPPAAPQAPGEFTRMFRSPSGDATAAEPTRTAQIPAFKPPAEAGKAPVAGEFTQMFHAQTGQVKTPEALKTAQSPAPPPPTQAAKPTVTGEFTQMFHAPTGQMKAAEPAKAAAPPPVFPPPAETPKAPVAGEFTQMFHAPTGHAKAADPLTKAPTPPAFPPPAAAPPVNPAPPGEFTSMFQTAPHQLGEAPAKPITSRGLPPGVTTPAAQPPGEFTRMFSASPGQPMGEKPSSSVTSGPAPAAQPLGQEPGEFTRVFSRPGAGSLPKQQLPVAAPQASPLSQPNPFAPPTSPLAQPMIPPNPASASPFGQPASPFGAPPPGPASPFGPQSPLGQPQAPQGGLGAIPQRPYAAPAQPSVQDEYAKLFGGGGGQPSGFPASPQPPVSQPHQGGGFGGATQSFQAPQMSMPPAQAAGPSEYTRMFNAPRNVQAPAPAPVPPIPIPVAAAKGFPKWPFFVAGGVLLLLIVGLVVTLLRK